jgi:hypothetical protein
MDAINNNKFDMFQPKFISDKNGRATLNDSTYLETLRKYQFSDSVIIKEKYSYKTCIDNLKNVKFVDFAKTIYIDLDEYENSNCDFGNYHRWIGGQEPIVGIMIIKFLIKDNRAVVTFQNYNHEPIKHQNGYWCENNVFLIKQSDKWYINAVES